ncbi:hypothetical protein M4D79_22905 [Mycolicibacterium novocastrense]|nr:hypothetical protein M4D79_22905 [Mycolicibacterium novocastrense]
MLTRFAKPVDKASGGSRASWATRVTESPGIGSARRFVVRASLRSAEAGLDVCDCFGRLGPADGADVDRSGGQEGVDAVLEITVDDVGVEVRARTRGVVAGVAVPGERVGRDVESLCAPGEGERSAVELLLGDLLLVEVAFADDQEVAGRVVVRGGVADEFGLSLVRRCCRCGRR